MKDHRKESFERLIHIQVAISTIENFIRDMDEDTFLNNQLVSSAVLFQFSVIGEAVIYIDSELLQKYDYPWYKVRSFRNLISHVYFQIKLEAVWGIIANDLTELKQLIENILNKEFH